jgi:hypothetical protein
LDLMWKKTSLLQEGHEMLLAICKDCDIEQLKKNKPFVESVERIVKWLGNQCDPKVKKFAEQLGIKM